MMQIMGIEKEIWKLNSPKNNHKGLNNDHKTYSYAINNAFSNNSKP